MKIAAIGTGFVGVITSAVFASFGHEVIGLDINEKRIKLLNQGKAPFYEPGLTELLAETLKSGNLSFTTSYEQAISNAEIVLIMVGTPSAADGQADLKYVFQASKSLAPFLMPGAIVVLKSTVPPGTNQDVQALIAQHTQVDFTVASIPEFLREGSAVEDTLKPSRVIIGCNDEKAAQKLAKLHQPLTEQIEIMKPESAQMSKYAANTFLATRITFINQIADLCEKNGADVQEVITGVGLDPRIGQHYWYPGFGYGGSCFPKDVSELAAYSRAVGEENNLMNKIHELNQVRIAELMTKYGRAVGGWQNKQVAVLGLSFKPNTDDMREAPALSIVTELINAGAQVTGFDPRAKWPDEKTNFSQVADIETAVKNADVIMAVIEWPEITSFDFGQTKEDKNQVFIDGRNQFDPETVKEWGYQYFGIGRS